MNTNLISCIVLLLICTWSCQNKNEEKQFGGKKLNSPIQKEKGITFFTSLPINKYSKAKIDSEDLFTVKLNDRFKSQLKYNDYYFDTVINSSTFQFYFHCLGGENFQTVTSRYLNEINEHFGEMIEASNVEKHTYSLSSCDSLVVEKDKVIYKRFQSLNLGGQSLNESEYFKFSSINAFYTIINNEFNSLENRKIVQHRRTKKIIWM